MPFQKASFSILFTNQASSLERDFAKKSFAKADRFYEHPPQEEYMIQTLTIFLKQKVCLPGFER